MVPGRGRYPDRARDGRLRHRIVRRRVSPVSAPSARHDRGGAARRSASPATRPRIQQAKTDQAGLAGRVLGHGSEGRTQDRTPHPPGRRRTQKPDVEVQPESDRLHHASRRNQPCASRHRRTPPRHHRLDQPSHAVCTQTNTRPPKRASDTPNRHPRLDPRTPNTSGTPKPTNTRERRPPTRITQPAGPTPLQQSPRNLSNHLETSAIT